MQIMVSLMDSRYWHGQVLNSHLRFTGRMTFYLATNSSKTQFCTPTYFTLTCFQGIVPVKLRVILSQRCLRHRCESILVGRVHHQCVDCHLISYERRMHEVSLTWSIFDMSTRFAYGLHRFLFNTYFLEKSQANSYGLQRYPLNAALWGKSHASILGLQRYLLIADFWE